MQAAGFTRIATHTFLATNFFHVYRSVFLALGLSVRGDSRAKALRYDRRVQRSSAPASQVCLSRGPLELLTSM